MKTKLILAAALAAAIASAQVPAMPAAVALRPPNVQLFDNSGKPCAGCKLYTYAAGTSTPLPTYTDASAATPNPNPVTLDSSGRAAIWIKGQAYKLVLQTAAGAAIWTTDSVVDTTLFYIEHLKYISDSALLSFRPHGAPTGSIVRPVQDKLSDISNVRDFGAVGDGSANDTAAINNAIAARATAGGGSIDIPAGTFKITSPIHMAPGVSLRCASPSSSVIAAYDTDAITFDFYGADPQDTYIEHCGIKGMSGTTRRAIYQAGTDSASDETDGVTIRDNAISNFNVAIKTKNTWKWIVSDNWISDVNTAFDLTGKNFNWFVSKNHLLKYGGNGGGASYGILMDAASFGAATFKVEGARISENFVYGFSTAAIKCNYCYALNVTGNDIMSTGVGIQWVVAEGPVNVKDNYIELIVPATHGILGSPLGDIPVDLKTNIEGNAVYGDAGNTADGINLGVNQIHASVLRNIFFGLGSTDIVADQLADLRVDGNDCYSTGSPTSISIQNSSRVILGTNKVAGAISAPGASLILTSKGNGAYPTAPVDGTLRAAANDPYHLGVILGTLSNAPDYGGVVYLTTDDGAAQKALRIRSTFAGVGTSGYPNFAIDVSTNDQAYGADPSTLTYTTIMSIDASTKDVTFGGLLKNKSVTYADLPDVHSTPTGAILYCSDCAAAPTCASGSGTGRLAFNDGASWKCQ